MQNDHRPEEADRDRRDGWEGCLATTNSSPGKFSIFKSHWPYLLNKQLSALTLEVPNETDLQSFLVPFSFPEIPNWCAKDAHMSESALIDTDSTASSTSVPMQSVTYGHELSHMTFRESVIWGTWACWYVTLYLQIAAKWGTHSS